jgi:hypothetical protein
MVTQAGLEDPHGTLAQSLVALGRIALEHPAIVEIDVNPMIVTAERTIAVDALVVTEKRESS